MQIVTKPEKNMNIHNLLKEKNAREILLMVQKSDDHQLISDSFSHEFPRVLAPSQVVISPDFFHHRTGRNIATHTQILLDLFCR